VIVKSSLAQTVTRNIAFHDCDFKQTVYGIVSDDDSENIIIDGGIFKNLYKGIKLGENTNTPTEIGPKGIKIVNSFFDDITREALHVYKTSSAISAFNFYKNVGNSGSTPQYNIINFESDGNSSFSDSFERSDTDDETKPRINYGSSINYLVETGKKATHGRSVIFAGKQIELPSPATNSNINGMVFDANEVKSVLIYYTAKQNNAVRNGMLKISADSNGSTISDDFVDNGNSIDLVFSTSVASGNTVVEYTSSDPTDITLSFRIEQIL
jgi:hypothetical protein